MPSLIVPDVCRYYIDFELGSRPCACILDQAVVGTTGSRAVAVAKVAEKLLSAWHAGPRTRQSNEISLLSVSWLDLNSSTGTVGSTTTGPGGTPVWPSIGGVAEDSFPSNVALRVEKATTATRGLRKGRMYVPGISESDTDVPNTVASTRLAAWQTQFTALLTAIGAWSTGEGDYVSSPCVIHQPIDDDPSYTLVTSFTPQATLRSQGRRLRG